MLGFGDDLPEQTSWVDLLNVWLSMAESARRGTAVALGVNEPDWIAQYVSVAAASFDDVERVCGDPSAKQGAVVAGAVVIEAAFVVALLSCAAKTIAILQSASH